jgi:hypothetical protein
MNYVIQNRERIRYARHGLSDAGPWKNGKYGAAAEATLRCFHADGDDVSSRRYSASKPVWACSTKQHASCGALHLGAQGLLSVLVVDAVSEDLRGTGFGLFNLVTGVLLLVASVRAGALWTVAGPGWTFAAGAVFASLAALGMVASLSKRHLAERPS